jgi:hypothetical protein
MRLGGLAILTILAACLVTGSSAAPQARVAVGVYAGDVPRFDRLTGQRTASALAFIGWDQGRTWGKPYGYFLDTLGERPHIALKTDHGSIVPLTR